MSRSATCRHLDDAVPTEPRFVSEAFFMDFKFEPGNYYLAGREKFEGQEVLRSSTTRPSCSRTTIRLRRRKATGARRKRTRFPAR